MKLSPELERKCLELAGQTPDARLREPRVDEKPNVVAAAFVPPATWILPIVTVSESNQRDWRSRSGRTKKAKKAVSVGLGKTLSALSAISDHYHDGRSIRVKLTRLATRKIDAANLGGALKATEDAVAFMIGADDGDHRWIAEFHQEIGDIVGVRIELEPA